MKEVKLVTSHIDELRDFDWLSYSPDENDVIFVNNQKSIMEAAKLWGISPQAVEAIKDALAFMAESFVDHIKEDLVDIWKRSNQ